MRRAWNLVGAASAALAAVALTGCGGSGSTGTTSGSPTSHVTVGAAQSSVISLTNVPEAAKSPAQIIADTEAALGLVHSFSIVGATVQSGRSNLISANIQLPGKISATLTSGPAVAHIVVIASRVYFNANPAYLTAQNSSAAVIQAIANRWVYFPAGAGPSLGKLAAAVNPATIGRCLVGVHLGTLSVQGKATVSGQPAVVLVDKGDVPGSTPGRLYVARTGPTLPLKTVQTGPQAPGGVPDVACMETKEDVSGDTTASTALYRDYNSAPAVTAPAGAVSISTIEG